MSIVGGEVHTMWKLSVDATISVKVKCLIPSEFGVNTSEALGTKLGQILGFPCFDWVQ